MLLGIFIVVCMGVKAEREREGARERERQEREIYSKFTPEISELGERTVASNAHLGAKLACPPGLLGLPGPQYCLPGPQHCLSWPAGRQLDANWASIGRQLDVKWTPIGRHLSAKLDCHNGCQCQRTS